MKLKQKPPKDGLITEYECGLVLIGSWASRLNKYEEYCNTKQGSYILKLESNQITE